MASPEISHPKYRAIDEGEHLLVDEGPENLNRVIDKRVPPMQTYFQLGVSEQFERIEHGLYG